MPVIDWHDLRQDLAKKVAANDQAGFDAILNAAIAQNKVKVRPYRIIEIDDKGRAYHAMGQTDVGVVLIEAERQWGDDDYLSMSSACMEVAIDKLEDGGLRSAGWLHSVTSDDGNFPGGTLNQHLVSVRNLLRARELLAGYPETMGRYLLYAVKGMEQLDSGRYPNLSSFFLPSGSNASWAYYSVNVSTQKGYFLSTPGKTGNYHCFVMELLYRINGMIPREYDWSDLKEPMKKLLAIYEKKLADGLYKDSREAPNGDFGRLDPDLTQPLDSKVLSFYRSL